MWMWMGEGGLMAEKGCAGMRDRWSLERLEQLTALMVCARRASSILLEIITITL